MSGMPQQLRSMRILFPDAEEAYLAIYRLRAAGFRIDITGSRIGDVVVIVQATAGQVDELSAIASDHDGRLGTEEQTDAAPA